MPGLTDIADRLTPSAPIEITFGAQPNATGRKIATLFGHRASSGGTGTTYHAYDVVNVGDPDAVLAEVDGLAGTGSQIGKMAAAFVKCNALLSNPRNFPAFRVVLLANGDTDFGASDAAITAVKHLRSDFLVSCYPAQDDDNLSILQDLQQLISGIDRDLQGQFGSFIQVGSIEALSAQIAYDYNDRGVLIATLPDSAGTPSNKPEILAAAHAAGLMSLAFPYKPVLNMVLGGLVPPTVAADIISLDPAGDSESALNNGLSPLIVQPGGKVAYVRSVTTYTTLPSTIRVTSYFDWQDLVVLNDFRETCYQVSQNPPFNNNPGGTKASQSIAKLFKDEVLREAKNYEDLGAFQNVKENAKEFVVEISATSRGRFDFRIPVDVIPGLMVIAGNIEAVSSLETFTL